MSRIFTDAARTVGFKARRVQLVRTLLNDKDTHVTSEVLLDDHWVVFNPTFNVSYEKGGRLLGAAEIHQSTLDGTAETIRPVFSGEVEYPARLKDYYLNWLALYSNVAIFQEAQDNRYSRFPPFRFWLGPSLEYLESQPTGLWQLRFANQEYFFYAVILPFVAVLCSVVCVCFLQASRHAPRKVVPARARIQHAPADILQRRMFSNLGGIRAAAPVPFPTRLNAAASAAVPDT